MEDDNPLESPLTPADFFPASDQRLKISKTFGKYRIVKEIGRGGMGAVFLAERADGEFKQQVALKIIRQSITDRETESRFRRERELLAGLSHPNIAHLIDGGVSQTGEPFFAMEFVDGQPLLHFVQERHLSIRERLILFLKICSAVAYSHKNLIVHRDLKPQNILVTEDGEPKLLDFGLAKVLDNSADNQTATQFRAFTPAYASPEQILGKRVSTASDIYSLGLILFELLTETRPFDHAGKSLDELVKNLTLGDPPKPSTMRANEKTARGIAERIENDLDTIVLKCLEFDLDNRYATVDELAGDIRLFLDGRPISARPQTFGYRAAKFIRRNRVAAIAVFLVALTIAGGLSVSIWQATIARRERDRAEKRFQDVRKLAGSLLFEITPKIETLEGSLPARQSLVARSLEYLDNLAAEAAGDPQLLAELAAAYEKVGELQGHHTKPNTGDLAGALESYKKANEIRRSLPQTLENKRLLAENFRQLSDARWWQGDTEGSRQDLASAIQLYEAILAEDPENLNLRIASLRTLNDLAQWYQASNRYPEAISLSEQIIAGAAVLDYSRTDVREIYYVTHADLGNSLSWNNQQLRAEKEMAVAVKGMEDLVKENPTDARLRHLLWRVYMLASVIYEDVNNLKSFEFAEKALSTAEKALQNEPEDIQARHNLARSTYRIGVILVNFHRVKSAIDALSKSESIIRYLMNLSPGNNYYLSDLGRIYLRKGLGFQSVGDFKRSNIAFEEALDIWLRLSANDPANKNIQRDIATTHMYIGDNLQKMRRIDDAAEKYNQAIVILTQLKNENALPEVDEPLIAKMERFIAKRR